MDLVLCYTIIVLSTLQSYVFKVIPLNRDHDPLKEELKLSEGDDLFNDVEEEPTYETVQPVDVSVEKVRKKKAKPKPFIEDTIYPDKPPLVLLKFPATFTLKERDKLLDIVDRKFGRWIDMNSIKKVAKGETEAMPDLWSFVSNFDVKGAFTALLAKQFLKNYQSVDVHITVNDISRKECKKLCRDKEIRLIQFMNSALIHLTETELDEEDLRVRVRPNSKKCFIYESKEEHSTCTCIDVGKNIYVSPSLKKYIEQKFFNSDEGEKEIEQLIQDMPLIEEKKNNSGWSFSKLGYVVLQNMGFGSERTRGHGRKYDKHWFESKIEWILINALLSVVILTICFPLWPFQVIFFIVGWYFV